MCDSRSVQLVALMTVATAVVVMVMVKRCGRVLAAIDLGSGEHKLVIARVSGHRVRVLVSESVGVALGVDLRRPGSDGLLSEAILDKSRLVLERFCKLCAERKVQARVGVATAVFRRAKNGPDHIRAMNEIILLKVIGQRDEGRLGFLTAVAAAARRRMKVDFAFDSGGGSFQITSRDQVYEGPIGNADAYAILRDMSEFDVDLFVEKLRAELPPAPDWLKDRPDAVIVGFGHTTSIFRLAADLAGTPDLTIDNVKNALDFVYAKRNDKASLAAELRELAKLHASKIAPFDTFIDQPYPEASLITPKLGLLLAVMMHLDLRTIHYEQANGNCLGLFLDTELWNTKQ